MQRFFGYTRLPLTGAPAPLGTVTVYEVGTLTLASLFDDADGATPKANPFTAASDGYFFFYAEDGNYDVRFSGGGIVTPFTWGDVQLDSSGGIIASTAATFPPVAATATTAILRRRTDQYRGLWIDDGVQWTSVQAEVLNVKQFGAVGDGVTDDTAAIQAAIDAAAATASYHQPVYLPGGEYSVTTLSIPATGVSLLGAGYRFRTTIVQRDPGSATSLITCDTSSGQQKGPTLRDLFLQGHPTNGLHVVHITGSKGALLDNLVLAGPGPNGACLRINDSSRTIACRNIRIENKSSVAGTRGLWIGDAADADPLTTSIWIDNLMMYNIGATERFDTDVIFLDNTGQVTITNSKLDGVNGAKGIHILKGGSHRFVNFGLEVPVSLTTAIHIENAKSVEFVDCGLPTNTTNGLVIVNSVDTRWRGGRLRGAISIDATSKDTFFEHGVYQRTGTAAITITDLGTNTIWNTMRAETSAAVIQNVVLTNEVLFPLVFQRFDESGGNNISSAELYLVGGGTTAPFLTQTMPFGGVVVGISIQVSKARTGGTLEAIPRKNGANLSTPRATIDGTNTLAASTLQKDFDSSSVIFAAGDTLGVRVVETGYGPLDAAVRITLLVLRRGSPGAP